MMRMKMMRMGMTMRRKSSRRWKSTVWGWGGDRGVGNKVQGVRVVEIALLVLLAPGVSGRG